MCNKKNIEGGFWMYLKVISKTLASILKACVTAVCFKNSYKSYWASRKGAMKLNQETK